jgi:hypothetical protein
MAPFQTSVILTKQAATWLDEQALAIRQRQDAAVSRSQLLRGIVAGLMAADFDLSSCNSEKLVAQWVEGVLKLGMTLLRPRSSDRPSPSRPSRRMHGSEARAGGVGGSA